MRVVLRSVNSLKPYKANPRINDQAVKAVARSISEFGFRQPIVIDAKGVIIVGHTRWKAAKKLGLKRVPVHVAGDLTDEQKRAYRIADNQTANLGDWDYELLAQELGELGAVEFDFDALGFPADQLARLLEPGPKEGLTDPDAMPDPPKEAVTRPGDLWTLGDHRLLCGDCTEPQDVQRLMGSDRAQMCFTDPPWNVRIGQDSNPRHRQREGLVNDDLDEAGFGALLVGFARAMRPILDADLYCVLGIAQLPALHSCLRGEGYHWSGTIIWAKNAFVLGHSNYHRRYEPIWYGWHSGVRSSFAGGRAQDDVWEIARPWRSEEHPTMKPVELVAKAIQNSSLPDRIVYDGFCGSGTTVIAAERLGRRCFCLEIDPRYCDVIVQRWEEFTGQKAERHAGRPARRRKPRKGR